MTDDDDDKFKKLDPRRAELAGKNKRKEIHTNLPFLCIDQNILYTYQKHVALFAQSQNNLPKSILRRNGL